MKKFLRSVARRSFGQRGAQNQVAHVDIPRLMLQRCPGIGEIQSVIDIGASDGRWSVAIHDLVPRAKFALVEANPVHYPALYSVASSLNGAHVIEAAAGESSGTLNFDKGDAFGGLATSLSLEAFNKANHQARNDLTKENFIEVASLSIDQVVERYSLKPPFLIKIDTHGFEPQIIRGMRDTLRNTSIIQIEAYNFDLVDGAWRFHELISKMDEFKFRVFDIGEIGRRPSDFVLWQLDIYFIPSNCYVFERSSYS